MRLLEYTHAIYLIDPIAKSTPNDGDKTLQSVRLLGGRLVRFTLATALPVKFGQDAPHPEAFRATRGPSSMPLLGLAQWEHGSATDPVGLCAPTAQAQSQTRRSPRNTPTCTQS